MDLSLISEEDCFYFEYIIRSAKSQYKQLVEVEYYTHGYGSGTPGDEPTLPDGYQAALPTEPVAFQTMMCQAVSTTVASSVSASTQDTPPPKKAVMVESTGVVKV